MALGNVTRRAGDRRDVPEADGSAAIDRAAGGGVSIGDELAEGRRQAGLTVTQVSQRTCIRETIIRSIERGDFSGCGGDFYARGHIRSIAGVVGVDSQPLIDEYEATMGPPAVISAAEVFQPVVPVKLRERRKPNWTAGLAIAVLFVGGIFAYQHFAGRSVAAAVRHPARHQARAVDQPSPPQTTSQASRQVHHGQHLLDIRLTATRNCWVQLTSVTGATIYSGMVYRGTSRRWVERHAVTMIIGNPAAVRLRVNGKNPVPPGSVTTLTLRLRAGKA
jgi:cytoskeletal protein RodZ